MLSREVHEAKALSPIVLTDFGKVILFILTQLLNAFESIVSIPNGKFHSVIPLVSEREYVPILFSVVGRTNSFA